MKKLAIGLCAAVFGWIAVPVEAQDDQVLLEAQPFGMTEPVVITPQLSWYMVFTRQQELAEWQKALVKYEDWAALYGNRYGWVQIPRPAPPTWLRQDCADTALESVGVEGDACILLAQYDEDYVVAKSRIEARTAVALQEKDKHTSWRNRTHLDGGWTRSNWSRGHGRTPDRPYGVIGMHVTFPPLNFLPGLHYLQVYAFPGPMLYMVPTPTGRIYLLGVNYGGGIQIMKFHFPGYDGLAGLNANVAKGVIFGNKPGIAGRLNSSIDVMGLSITFLGK